MHRKIPNRPCLKTLATDPPSSTSILPQITPILPFSSTSHLPSPHVHFPPSPLIISSTHATHSPRTYDRAPIQVRTNVCAFPERGERLCHVEKQRTLAHASGYFDRALPGVFKPPESEPVPDLTYLSSSDDSEMSSPELPILRSRTVKKQKTKRCSPRTLHSRRHLAKDGDGEESCLDGF
ncbi:hypothetical protein DL96DRAFT_119949 [Flagelloscypha sp. PMI_526]|nr:hypothetical protein DL96DRAFT_119949 [Flagelloscypha sp. PMI_526]